MSSPPRYLSSGPAAFAVRGRVTLAVRVFDRIGKNLQMMAPAVERVAKLIAKARSAGVLPICRMVTSLVSRLKCCKVARVK